MSPTSRPLRQTALRTYLVLVMVGSMLPFLVVSGVLLLRVLQDDRVSVERTLIGTARQQATALDAEMDATVRTLNALAASSHLQNDDLEGFEREARAAARTQHWVGARLLTAEPRLVFDTATPPGETPSPIVDVESLRRVLAQRTPTIATMQRSASGSLAFAVRIPVLRDGAVRYVLTAVVGPDAVADVLMRESPPPTEWTRTIVDSRGTIVARTRAPERFVGTAATPSFMAHVTASDGGFYQDSALEGEPVYVAFAQSRLSGWVSGVVVPRSFMDSPIRRSMGTLAVVALLVLLSSGSGAYWLAGRISSDIGAATAAAETLARGQSVQPVPSIVSDVTRLGQALERSSVLLAERSADRDRNLAQAEAARAEAEQANSAKDQFLAMLGHELRNPLSPIVTALALLRMRQSEGSRELAVIERQVDHMSRLVNDLLDVSRITRGTLELRKEPLDVADVITRAAEMAAPRLEEKRHALTLEVPPGLTVIGDAVRLAQVFGNLLANAAAYTPEGGAVRVAARREGAQVHVEVTDNGRRLAPGMAQRIFDLFVQGPRTIDRQEGGLGLGLAIARSLVEQHEGRIEARSEGPGRGSTFVITLPAAAAGLSAAGPRKSTPVPASHRLHILLVDDNADAADMLATFLGTAGHRVVTASDGPQALDVLRTMSPDVAVLDIGLPVMDGYELARRIHEFLGPRTPLLIAVTGYGQIEDAERSREAGFSHHLVKPVDGDDLLTLLASVAPRA